MSIFEIRSTVYVYSAGENTANPIWYSGKNCTHIFYGYPMCVRVSASASVGILVNASRAIDIYYVVHIDYILYIGGLKPIGEGVIYECLHVQQLQAGLEPRPHLP